MTTSKNDLAPELRQQSEADKANTAPEFSRPRPGSVKANVLNALLAGDRLTHKDCWIRFGSSRLAHHVLMLRKAGWPIVCDEIKALTSDGRIASIGLYWLKQGAANV